MIISDLLYGIAIVLLFPFVATYVCIADFGFNRYYCSICSKDIDIDESIIHKISIRNYAHVPCHAWQIKNAWRNLE